MAEVMADVQGWCDERFRRLEAEFRSNLEQGVDEGVSLAATYRGDPVVDLWGGTRDYGQSVPWEADTLVRVFSTSKVMIAITAMLLVDRGLLDLDAPVADHWPEFARHGKGTITARQVLTHHSGLPGFGRHVSLDELGDWELIVGLLEDAEPWYEPGTMMCYSGVTYGYIVGELVRRLTGQPFADFFRDEVTGPLDADFHFALTSPDDHDRVAALWPPEQIPELDNEMGAAVMDEVLANEEYADPAYLATVVPATTGITNGRALARIGSLLAMGGELDGRRLLSEAVIDEATREQVDAECQVLGRCRLGLGLGLDSEEFPAPTPTTFHWGGFGGSFVTMDRATGLSVGFAPNRLRTGDRYGEDARLLELWRLIGEVSADLH